MMGGREGAEWRDAVVRLAGVLAGVAYSGLVDGVIELVADRLLGVILEPLDAFDGRIRLHMTGKCHRRALQHSQRIEQADADARRVCLHYRFVSFHFLLGVVLVWFGFDTRGDDE